MTLDKIKHYLGSELYDKLCAMKEKELKAVQQINITDIADEPQGTERANLLHAEKTLIDYLLGKAWGKRYNPPKDKNGWL